MEGLTELSEAFGGAWTGEDDNGRGRIIAALVASDYDPASAAQLLLETQENEEEKHEQGHIQERQRLYERRGFCAASNSGVRVVKNNNNNNRSNKRVARNSRRRGGTPLAGVVGINNKGIGNGMLLGATCGDKYRGLHKGGGSDDGEEGCDEEEEGDEGADSEEYRGQADAAAEEMKTWFQKAAEAYTKGGR